MRTVFLAGGIGSGKSTVATKLEKLGCTRIDLDQLSREVLQPNSPIIGDVLDAFGHDLVDEATGELDRPLLAQRAFATPEAAAKLEAIEIPAIVALLRARLTDLGGKENPPLVTLVEVPLLDRAADMLPLADEVLVVWCPYEVRRERAIGRGMTAEDFGARAANQPTDEWLLAQASSVIDNSGTTAELDEHINAWWQKTTGRLQEGEQS